MNKQHHILNATFVGIALAVATVDLEPTTSTVLAIAWRAAAIVPPVVLGALIPDLDHIVGTHRKTGHNLPLLGAAMLYPATFGNLSFLWVGILAHYLLDLLTTRGLALFYPLSKREWDIPPNIPVDSRAAGAVTSMFTVIEILVVVLAAEHGVAAQPHYAFFA